MIRYYSKMSESDKKLWIENLFSKIDENPEIKVKIAVFSYNDEKLNEGKGLFQKFSKSLDLTTETKTESLTAHSSFVTLFDLVISEYGIIRDIADVAFKNIPDKYIKLGLNLPPKTKQSDSLKTIDNFFKVALNDDEILELLGKYSYSKEKIEELKKLSERTIQSYSKFYGENSDYHAEVADKKTNAEKMEAYLKDFVKILRAIFGKDEKVIKLLRLDSF